MAITSLGPDGLRILAESSLSQLATDEILLEFAAGLIPTALHWTHFSDTLAAALHHPGPEVNPLLTTLLVLDAEVDTYVADKHRLLPLPGFLSYRSHLPVDKFPPHSLRLPPLNPDGCYLFTTTKEDSYLALRLDLHPTLKVTGHVRLAVSSQDRFPSRLAVSEHRLDRQVLTEEIIAKAISTGSEALPTSLSNIEQTKLIETLRNLIF